MNPAVLRWLQANMKTSIMNSKWIIHAQHCNLKRLVTDEPEEIKVFNSEETAHRQDYFSNRFQKDLLQVTSDAYSFVRISSVLGWRPQGREVKKLAYLLGRKLRI